MENWKDIQGYEGLYQVSNLGNVKSLKSGRYRTGVQIILKKLYHKGGYPFQILTNLNKEKKSLMNHRLVAQAFLGLDINNKKILVCHKDDNPLNDNLDNLFLGTHRDNMIDMVSKNRNATRKGDDCNFSRLKSNDIINIRYLHSIGKKYEYITTMYNIYPDHFWRICKRKVWKHI